MTYGSHRRLAYLRSSNVALPEKEDFMKLEVSRGVRTTQDGAQTHDVVEQKVLKPGHGFREELQVEQPPLLELNAPIT